MTYAIIGGIIAALYVFTWALCAAAADADAALPAVPERDPEAEAATTECCRILGIDQAVRQ